MKGMDNGVPEIPSLLHFPIIDEVFHVSSISVLSVSQL